MISITTKRLCLVSSLLYIFSILALVSTDATASFEPSKDVSIVWKKPVQMFTRSNFHLVKISSDKMVFSHFYKKEDNTQAILLRCFTTDNLLLHWEQSIPFILKNQKGYRHYVLQADNIITYVVETFFENGDSTSILGLQVDAGTGTIITNKQLFAFNRVEENRTKITFTTSPDTSFALFSRYDYSPYNEDNKLEVRIEAMRIRKDLSSMFLDTFTVPLIKEFDKLPDWGMNNDEVYLDKSLPFITVDNAGSLYQVTYSSPNQVTTLQWPVGSKSPKSLSLPVNNVDVTNRDMTFYRPSGSIEPKHPNIIHIAGGCLANSKTITDRYFFATFDFVTMKVTKQWQYTPAKNLLEQLIDDDEMDRFKVGRIEVSSVDSSVLLICQKDLTKETYDVYMKASGQMRKTSPYTKYTTGDFLIFSVDNNGTVRWTNAIRNEAEDRTLTSYIKEDSVRRLIYYDNENDGFVQRTFNIKTGAISPLKKIAEVTGSDNVNINEFIWTDHNTIVTLVIEGDDEKDMHFIKLTGL